MLNVKVRGIAALLLAAALVLPAQGWAAEATPAPMPMPPGARTPGGAPDRAPVETISREAALAAIEQWFKLPADGPGRLEANLSTWGPRPTWEFMYMIERDNGGRGFGVGRVDAQTGQILEFNLPLSEVLPMRTGPRPQPHSRTEAWLKAWQLVQGLYPEAAGRVRTAPAGLEDPFQYYYPSSAHDVWRFYWLEYVDGVPVPGSLIHVGIDKETLEFVSVRYGLQEQVTYQPQAVTLSPNDALEAFRSMAKPQLSYQPAQPKLPYGQRAQAVSLVYRFDHLMGALSAATGKPVQSVPAPFLQTPGDAVQPVAPGDPALAVRPASLPLQAAEIPAVLTPLLVGLPEGSRWVADPNSYVYDYTSPFPPMMARLETPDGGGGSGSATVDMATGQVRHAYRWNSSGGPGRAYTDEDYAKALAVATDLVQQLYHDLVPELRVSPVPLIQRYDPTRAQYFFQRFVNGIPVAGHGIHVTIDMESLSWNSLSLNWQADLSFPDPAGVIGPEKALEGYLAGRRAILAWQLQPVNPEAGYSDGRQQVEQKATLVYRLSRLTDRPDLPLVDARSGEVVDYAGGRPFGEAEKDRLLAGHWAEGELRFLAATGAIDLQQTPLDKVLTRGEALQLLIYGTRYIWMGGGRPVELPYTDLDRTSPYYQAVQDAYRKGWLQGTGKSFEADRPVTRIEAAVWLANGLGLNRLMQSSLQAESRFTDLAGLSRPERNAVVLLEALGILGGYQGSDKFGPQAELTVAEAAALVGRFYNELMASGRQ